MKEKNKLENNKQVTKQTQNDSRFNMVKFTRESAKYASDVENKIEYAFRLLKMADEATKQAIEILSPLIGKEKPQT